VTRREEICDVAIATLAGSGMRGLTHRAVDRAAGLPEGSASYYFRTREALLNATVRRLADVDAADIEARPALAGAADPDAIAEATADLLQHWLTTGRERMLARYELALEANRRPELRRVLTAAGTRSRELARAMLEEAGAGDPARQAPLFAACLDGILFDHLAGAGGLALGRDGLVAAVRDLLRSFCPSADSAARP
jgi:DNA-binding transcriptional regulator YbjK